MTVTKQGLTEQVADGLGLTARESKQIVEAFFKGIAGSLIAGEDVLLSGFGRFTLLDKRARPGRNPRTLEPKEIKARRVVAFHASQGLKERLMK